MISIPSIVRAAIARFIPGVLVFLGVCLCATAKIKGITLGPDQIDGLTVLTLSMTLGFAASLVSIRFLLRSSAGILGRRGVAAGFIAPCVLLTLEMLHGSPVSHAVNYSFAFVAGALTTMALFVPLNSITSIDARERKQAI